MSDVKKGAKSWTPSNLGDIEGKEEGFRYRRVRKDLDNIRKKEDEGWETVSAINGPKTKAVHPESRPDEPKPITSNVEGRDWLVMRIPEETAKARDAYFNDRTEKLETMLHSDTRRELSKSKGSLHGEIIKERAGVKTIIE